MPIHSHVSQRVLSRRYFLASAAAALATAASACAQSSDERPLVMTVYRDPSCGCCEEWARLSHAAGFRTTVIDQDDMPGRKQNLGVPTDLASCHTAVVNGLVIEGHVPFDQVHRLIRERPAAIVGLAVPAMPAGSPGMEMPDGRREPFQVFAFDREGRRRVFASIS